MKREDYYHMLDQEERKGHLKSTKATGISISYSDEVCEMSILLKEKRKKLRRIKKQVKKIASSDSCFEVEQEIKDFQEKILLKKHEEIDAIVKKLEHGYINIQLEKTQAKGKVVLTCKDLPSFLTCKIVSIELRRQYHVYPEDRNSIVDALAVHLKSKIHFGVLRTDIINFFESIPQVLLLDKLEKDNKLSKFAIKCIKRTFYG
ncbi:hypothetical protein L6471_03810 [Segatella bryantii]|uniref:hypothetical protein n=1 Tax=Segatella bryantii TaxID=77095 RepID=UPI001EDA3DAE|nr:hypothetical protein [Segatella bryantii]UKK74839.1 hypothetical protein L6471_03810 [Segatella bryantii]